MLVSLQTGWLLLVLLVAVRLGVVFYMTRIFAFAPIPEPVKIIFVLALAVVLLQAGQFSAPLVEAQPEVVLVGLAAEAVLGLILAFGVQTALGAYLWGGRILDTQMGFGVANLIDPATQTQAPMIGMLLSLAGLAVFFALDVHHLLLKGLFVSFEVVPPGQWLSGFSVPDVTLALSAMFALGLVMVAPAVVVLLLIDLVVAFASRTMPQLNAFFLVLPIKILVGLVVLAVSLNYFGSIHEKIFKSIFYNWLRLLR
ncbi:MAG TPA: flagellar biosynthetic protein FliR [Gammaproteobacteria bacterium]|nr:flagellar biosynthetic protein FliR [Gammaproteobacteria bacterium]